MFSVSSGRSARLSQCSGCHGRTPFRVGATSYVLPDHILPNVEYLAPMVDDVELVLFETDEYGSNLPGRAEVARLLELAAEHDLSYTVHLPLDLRLGEEGGLDHVSLVKARRVIESTRALRPWAYTLHLDARMLPQDPGPKVLAHWQERSAQALTSLFPSVDDPALLSIENLEAWDPDFFAPVLKALPVSRVIDVGHFWLRDADPLAHMERWLDRTRIIHLHGIAERDHSSLQVMPAGLLDPVVDSLLKGFRGVVTLEVFSLDDFTSSLTALNDSLRRVNGGGL